MAKPYHIIIGSGAGGETDVRRLAFGSQISPIAGGVHQSGTFRFRHVPSTAVVDINYLAPERAPLSIPNSSFSLLAGLFIPH